MRTPAARYIVWVLAMAVSLVGLWLSWQLTLQHWQSPKDTPELLARACTGMGQQASCEKVRKSRYAWFPPLPKEPATQPASKPAGNQAKRPPPPEADPDSPRVPSAQLGLIYFTCVLCWLVFIGPMTNRVGPHLLLLFGTLAGALASGVFEYIMWTRLDEIGGWCPLCLFAHISSFILPILALLLWPRTLEVRPVATVPRDSKPLFEPAAALASSAAKPWPAGWAVVMTICAALFLVGAEHFYIRNYSSNRRYEGLKYQYDYLEQRFRIYDRNPILTARAWYDMDPVEIPVANRPAKGPASAMHTIVIFSDFECPACREFDSRFRRVIMPQMRLKGLPAPRIVFKHWPINLDCNKHSKNTIHPLACKAALAAEAARMVGGDEAFWKMHDILFDRQADWRKTLDFAAYARELGLDVTRFLEAMNSAEATAYIQADANDGVRLGQSEVEAGLLKDARRKELLVDSTPAIFIDGKRFLSAQHPEAWLTILASRPQPRRPATTAPAAGSPPPSVAAPE